MTTRIDPLADPIAAELLEVALRTDKPEEVAKSIAGLETYRSQVGLFLPDAAGPILARLAATRDDPESRATALATLAAANDVVTALRGLASSLDNLNCPHGASVVREDLHLVRAFRDRLSEVLT